MNKKTKKILEDVNLVLAFIAVALALLALTSCGTAATLTEQRDSLVVHVRDSVVYRDSIIYVPVPEGGDKAKLPDTDVSFLQTSVAESEAYVKDGVLHHSLRNRSEAIIPIKVSIPERIHSEERGLTRYLKEVQRIEVEKELSRWQRFLQSVGWSALIAGALWLAMKLAKMV